MTISHYISRWISLPLLALGAMAFQPALANKESDAELIKQIKSAYADGAYDKFNRLTSELPQKSIFRPYVDIWEFRFFKKAWRNSFRTEKWCGRSLKFCLC